MGETFKESWIVPKFILEKLVKNQITGGKNQKKNLDEVSSVSQNIYDDKEGPDLEVMGSSPMAALTINAREKEKEKQKFKKNIALEAEEVDLAHENKLHSILGMFSHSLKHRVFYLLNFIYKQAGKRFDWNRSFQMGIDKRFYPESNLVDILTFLFSNNTRHFLSEEKIKCEDEKNNMIFGVPRDLDVFTDFLKTLPGVLSFKPFQFSSSQLEKFKAYTEKLNNLTPNAKDKLEHQKKPLIKIHEKEEESENEQEEEEEEEEKEQEKNEESEEESFQDAEDHSKSSPVQEIPVTETLPMTQAQQVLPAQQALPAQQQVPPAQQQVPPAQPVLPVQKGLPKPFPPQPSPLKSMVTESSPVEAMMSPPESKGPTIKPVTEAKAQVAAEAASATASPLFNKKPMTLNEVIQHQDEAMDVDDTNETVQDQLEKATAEAAAAEAAKVEPKTTIAQNETSEWETGSESGHLADVSAGEDEVMEEGETKPKRRKEEEEEEDDDVAPLPKAPPEPERRYSSRKRKEVDKLQVGDASQSQLSQAEKYRYLT